MLSFFPRSGSRKKVAGGKSALTGLPAVIAYVRELLFLLYCPFEGVERAAYGYCIVIDHQKSGVFQKVVVTAQETALGISVLQGYHFIGLRQNGVVTLLVGLGVPFGLSLEGDNAFQTDMRVSFLRFNTSSAAIRSKPSHIPDKKVS